MASLTREEREAMEQRVAAGLCIDCGVKLGESEAKVFTVCDACWDKAYAPYRKSRSSVGEPGAPHP